ncbi:ion transporter [bacterium]|nr:ion transporter [bacterium]
MRNLMHNLYLILEDSSSQYGRWFAGFISTLILLNILEVMLETVPGKSALWEVWLARFEVFSVLVFTIEYLLRLWVCTLNPRYERKIVGRIRYALVPITFVDLLAILPFYLPLAFPLDLRVLRLLRLFRFLRLIKIARYSDALRLITKVIRGKREELLLVVFVCAVLLIFSSTLLYYVEHEAQPEEFSSIPASLWWGVVTVTTVGYGDIYPITIAGKIIASIFAVIGIALFALPAGVLAGGFAEEVKTKKNASETCPHCGASLSE